MTDYHTWPATLFWVCSHFGQQTRNSLIHRNKSDFSTTNIELQKRNINDNGDNNEKTKNLKNAGWEYSKNMGGNIAGGNFLGGNFSGGNSPGGNLIGKNFPSRIIRVGVFLIPVLWKQTAGVLKHLVTVTERPIHLHLRRSVS